MADLCGITTYGLQHVSAATSTVTKSIKRNNCLHTPYWSKFTAASHGFPVTTRLSCLFTDAFTCSLAEQYNNCYNLDCFGLSRPVLTVVMSRHIFLVVAIV